MREKSMKKTGTTVIAALMLGLTAVATTFVPGTAAVAQEKKDAPKVSAKVGKPLQAAQKAINEKKWDEALKNLREVQAMTGKSPYEEYVMNELLGVTLVRTKDYKGAVEALEASYRSEYFDKSQTTTRLNALAQIYYQLKNYDKAIDYGNQLIKNGAADDDMYTLVGQAYYIKGDYKGSLQLFDNYVNGQIRRGQKPKEQSLQMIMSSCVKLEDDDCTTRALERLVAYYPKPEYWQNLIHTMFQARDNNDRNLLHVYRLASQVDALRRPEDYTEMAQLAIEQGSPGEAQRILEKGFAKNVFVEQRDKDRNQRLLEAAKRAAQADLATLDKTAEEAAASKTGDKDIGVGLAYLSYQQYDKAIEAFNRGLAKGGVRNEAEARLLLGIAQLEAGKKEDAMKTFESVKGDPKLERLASLWGLHARQA